MLAPTLMIKLLTSRNRSLTMKPKLNSSNVWRPSCFKNFKRHRKLNVTPLAASSLQWLTQVSLSTCVKQENSPIFSLKARMIEMVNYLKLDS